MRPVRMLLRQVLILVVVCVIFVPPSVVRATSCATGMNEADCRAIVMNWPNWDPERACGNSPPSGANHTPDQKIAQTFIIGFDANMDKNLINALATKYHFGGIYTVGSRDAANLGFNSEFYKTLNTSAGTPLVVASDEEGGTITRYSYPGPGGTFASAQEMGKMTEADVKEVALGAAKTMTKNGITADLAPVLDLRPVGTPDRTFSDNPAVVTKKAAAFADGLQSSKVAPIFKHFPGFDDTTSGNTDEQVLRMTGSIEEVVKPYLDLAKRFPDAGIMLSNMNVSEFNANLPASLSPEAVDYLRTTVKFNGVITTDDLAVNSVTSQAGDLPKAVAASLAAGVTMPLFTLRATDKAGAESQMDAIIAAVKANQDAVDGAANNLVTIQRFKGVSVTGSADSGAVMCCGSGGGDISALEGNERTEQTYNFLTKNMGLSPVQAAIIEGVWMEESGPKLDPNATNPLSGAYGLAQWLGGRLSGSDSNIGLIPFAAKNGTNKSDFATQLAFAKYELEGPYKSSLARVKQASTYEDINQAVYDFEATYEGSGHQLIPQRQADARWVFQTYGKGTTPGDGTTPASGIDGSSGTCGGAAGECSVTSPVYKGQYSVAQLIQIFGDHGTPSSHPDITRKLVDFDFFGKKGTAHQLIVPCLNAVIAEIKQKGIDYPIKQFGCYRYDSDNGSSNIGVRSYHTYGAACDINWDTNPWNGATYDMPPGVVEAFKNHGFTWGGDWTSVKDWMHFEFHGINP